MRRLCFAAAAAIAMCLSASAALGCGVVVRVTYYEASPDFFRIEFLQGEGFVLDKLSVDLRPSRGAVFIDTPYDNSAPAGSRGISVTATTGWTSGSQRFSVRFRNFGAKNKYGLEVDLDDQATGGDRDRDHLNGSEIQGAMAEAELVGPNGTKVTVSGDFNGKGLARLGNQACA